MSSASLEFINKRVSVSTPSEIYRDLLASDIPGGDHATQHQVYYQCQQANSSLRRRDSDQLISAIQLLEDFAEKYHHTTYTSGNMRGLAVVVRDSITKLASEARELAMNATFGTHNTAMILFAVLAEVDGTGAPLAYSSIGSF